MQYILQYLGHDTVFVPYACINPDTHIIVILATTCRCIDKSNTTLKCMTSLNTVGHVAGSGPCKVQLQSK